MKKYYLLFIFFFIFVINAMSANNADSIKIEQLLSSSKTLKETDNRVLFFAKKFIDIPYVAHTLDKDKEEKLVINTRELDCTTFVETVLALTLCSQEGKYSYTDYCNQLCRLRYRNGKIAYTERLHYFTDWIEDNEKMGYISKVESQNAPFTAIQQLNVNYMSKHVSSYSMLASHPEWLPAIQKTEKSLTGRKYNYIPKNKILNNKLMRNTIKDGDIIVILTSKAGLDTSHLGIAVWKKDGLHLLNASQIHKKVIIEPMLLKEYMKKHPSQIGIRVIRCKN